jgi:hypothetical protein
MMRATPSSFRKRIFFCISAREQRKLGDPKEVRATRWGIDPCAVKKIQMERQVWIIADPPRD